MTTAAIEKDLIDMIAVAHGVPELKPEQTLRDAGLDSLEAVEVQLMIEDRWGSENFKEYHLAETVPVREIALEVERRLR